MWQFLVMCGDAGLYKTLTAAIHAFGGVANHATTSESAAPFVNGRKLDGMFVDIKVRGALELLRSIRRGSSNRNSIVVACAEAGDDANPLLNSVANFTLGNPLAAFEVKDILEAALPLMMAERDRYLRYQVMLPVMLEAQDQQRKAVTANISRGGMAVQCEGPFAPGAPIRFVLELPKQAPVMGLGEVAWVKPEGQIGIKFNLTTDDLSTSLWNWMDQKTDGPKS